MRNRVLGVMTGTLIPCGGGTTLTVVAGQPARSIKTLPVPKDWA